MTSQEHKIASEAIAEEQRRLGRKVATTLEGGAKFYAAEEWVPCSLTNPTPSHPPLPPAQPLCSAASSQESKAGITKWISLC